MSEAPGRSAAWHSAARHSGPVKFGQVTSYSLCGAPQPPKFPAPAQPRPWPAATPYAVGFSVNEGCSSCNIPAGLTSPDVFFRTLSAGVRRVLRGNLLLMECAQRAGGEYKYARIIAQGEILRFAQNDSIKGSFRSLFRGAAHRRNHLQVRLPCTKRFRSTLP